MLREITSLGMSLCHVALAAPHPILIVLGYHTEFRVIIHVEGLYFAHEVALTGNPFPMITEPKPNPAIFFYAPLELDNYNL